MSESERLDELDQLIEVENAQLQIISLRKKAIYDRLQKLEQERREICDHPELEQKSSYCGGSYYDRASTDYWNVCKRCGAKSEVTTETHSYYG